MKETNMGRGCNIYGTGDKCLNVVRKRDKKKTMTCGGDNIKTYLKLISTWEDIFFFEAPTKYFQIHI